MPLSSDCANREQLVIDEGQLIAGHYRLLEQVGSGSMGVVWRARDERLERIVGIKQLLLQPKLLATAHLKQFQKGVCGSAAFLSVLQCAVNRCDRALAITAARLRADPQRQRLRFVRPA